MIFHYLTTREEFERIVAEDEKNFPEPDRMTADEYMSERAFANTYVLKNDNDWIGYFQTCRLKHCKSVPLSLNSPFTDNNVYISAVSIFDPHKGKGYGKLLLAEIERQNVNDTLCCRIRADNISSLYLFKDFKITEFQTRNGAKWVWHQK